MLEEIKSAVEFLSRHIPSHSMTNEQRSTFQADLVSRISKRFAEHWHVHNPMYGNAFRAITMFQNNLDLDVVNSAEKVGLISIDQYFPSDLVIWINPHQVSYR